jgi:hypothetical protein
MKVSELMDVLRGSNPDAEVITCLKDPDADGDYLLLGEPLASSAEPYPGNDAKFLVHTTVTLGGLVSQACDPSAVRELAKAPECEADRMGLAATDPKEEYDIW